MENRTRARRWVAILGCVFASACATGVGGTGSGGSDTGASDGGQPVFPGDDGYLWTKTLDVPVPTGENQNFVEIWILTQPENIFVEDGKYYCDVDHDSIEDHIAGVGNASDEAIYDDAYDVVTGTAVDKCNEERQEQLLTYSTTSTTCEDAGTLNLTIEFDEMYINVSEVECSVSPDGGGDGLHPRAAGPANYDGLTTFDDVFDCSAFAPTCDVDTDWIDDLFDDQQPLFDDTQALLIGSNGTVTGLKMISVGSSSLLDYLGFQQDDTVTEVNGDPTTTLDEAWGTIARYHDADTMEIEYYRGRVKKTLTIERVDLTTYP